MPYLIIFIVIRVWSLDRLYSDRQPYTLRFESSTLKMIKTNSYRPPTSAGANRKVLRRAE